MTVQVERYPAIVTRIEEEAKIGQIFVKCAGLTGDFETEYPDPVDPVFDWSWFYLPDIGESVEIEVVVADSHGEGVTQQAFLEEPKINWRGKRFAADESDTPRLPHELFTAKHYGKRRGIGTPHGHVLLFDDTEGEPQITIAWRAGPTSSDWSQLTFDKDGSIILSNKNGSILYLNAKSGEVMLADEHGNSLSMNDAGMKLIDIFNNSVELKDGAITVLAASDAIVKAGGNHTEESSAKTITTGVLTVDSDECTLGKGAADAMVLGDTWATARAQMNSQVQGALAALGGLWAAVGAAATPLVAPGVLVGPTAPLVPLMIALAGATAVAPTVIASAAAVASFEAAAATYLSQVNKTA